MREICNIQGSKMTSLLGSESTIVVLLLPEVVVFLPMVFSLL